MLLEPGLRATGKPCADVAETPLILIDPPLLVGVTVSEVTPLTTEAV